MSGASSAGQTRTQAGVLIPRGSVSLTLSQPHDPDAFYRTRSGLYVWKDFRDRIVANAKLVPTGTTYQLAVFELKVWDTDEQIEAVLPEHHLFNESALCAIVAEMVLNQRNGEPGDLEHTGRANLFYTACCIVSVHWSADYREWNVYTWKRVGGWHAGRRVFSPA